MDQFLQRIEQEPKLRAIKERLSDLEQQIQSRVSEDAWMLLLEWEAEWAQFVETCLQQFAAETGDKPDEECDE